VFGELSPKAKAFIRDGRLYGVSTEL
jgi:hypothetical protein